MSWLVLTYSLPAGPNSSPRVMLWRRLRRLGAVAVTGAYILPAREECCEAFQWLAQEIRHVQGEALLAPLEQQARGHRHRWGCLLPHSIGRCAG